MRREKWGENKEQAEPLLLLCLTANKLNSFTFTAGASPRGFLCVLHLPLFYFTMFYLRGKRLCVVSPSRSCCKQNKKKKFHFPQRDSEGSAEPSEPGCRFSAALDGFLAPGTFAAVTAVQSEWEYLPL